MTVRVVTLPQGLDGAAAIAFAERSRRAGATALEVRDDFTAAFEAQPLSERLALLLAWRGGAGFSAEARRQARWEDRALFAPVESSAGTAQPVVSHHADAPLSPQQAEAVWAQAEVTGAAYIKHVEPLGVPDSGARLLETQTRLSARFGEGRVTVLATGACAAPWRAVLAQRNAFDYLALDAGSASAAGQRLLADAVRADAAPGPRRALIGNGIAQAKSPRVHPAPFDRWDLPEDAPVGALIDALRAHYCGFAVTAPFKRALALHVKAKQAAINTVVRRPDGWSAANTDIEGARAVLRRHRVERFTVLGDGGATWALRAAAGESAATVMTAAQAVGAHVAGDVVWTWPEPRPTPTGLRLDGARVFVIAYGAAARRLSMRIAALGGQPVRAGATWFIAQARAQRRLWQEAS